MSRKTPNKKAPKQPQQPLQAIIKQAPKQAAEQPSMTVVVPPVSGPDVTLQPPSQQPQHHTKSQIRRQVSISSQNFVMCKMTDFQIDYQIISKIGEGSFGSVFRVKHRTLGIQRALKKIKKNFNSQFSTFQEIQVLKKLDHANILKIYQFYENNEMYMIVTQIFEGRQLFDQIIDCQKFSQQVGARVIQQILLTLNYTHSLGIAHRDIKPENILVRHLNDSNKLKIKIIDWGLGTLIRQQFSDRVCGTPQYAAPEVFQGKYSVACDMWSLGVLTFVMLTGNMPFKGTNTQETITQVKRCILNHRKSGFGNLSTMAKQFITSLIQKDQKKRMTAKKALEHGWITTYTNKKQEPAFLKETLLRLKQLNLNNHFGVAVLNLINNHFSSCEEKERLQQIFKFLDSNGDGVISSQELIQGYTKIYGKQLAQQTAAQTFAKLDVNNSGTIQYSQFIAYGLRRQRQKQVEKLKQAFDMIDSDKNGTISWNEVGKILEGKLSQFYQQDMKFLLSQFDENKNKQVDFDNFCKFMESLLSKVDGIIESKKRQSQIRAQKERKLTKQSNEKKLKKTESIDEPVEVEKVEQKQMDKAVIRQKRKRAK